MDPNSSTPSINPGAQSQPDLSMPPNPMTMPTSAPVTEVTVDINGSIPPVGPMPAASVTPSDPFAPVMTMPELQAMPGAFPVAPMPTPDLGLTQQPAAPLPMFNPSVPYTPPATAGPIMPGQPMPGQPQPTFGAPMPPMGGMPPAGPAKGSFLAKLTSNKKLLIIVGGVAALLIIGIILVIVLMSKAALVGKLGSDSYEGLKYKRPTAWIKDTSEKNSVGYHPKTALGKTGSGEKTYALKMNVSAQKDIFGAAPNDLKASDKAALQKAIDEQIDSASKDILPGKDEVGCSDDPVYRDKPVKVVLKDVFLAVKYSFTCKGGSGSSATTFYFSVLDVVPNNKDVEYLINLGAATENIYTTNLSKINEIIDSASF